MSESQFEPENGPEYIIPTPGSAEEWEKWESMDVIVTFGGGITTALVTKAMFPEGWTHVEVGTYGHHHIDPSGAIRAMGAIKYEDYDSLSAVRFLSQEESDEILREENAEKEAIAAAVAGLNKDGGTYVVYQYISNDVDIPPFISHCSVKEIRAWRREVEEYRVVGFSDVQGVARGAVNKIRIAKRNEEFYFADLRKAAPDAVEKINAKKMAFEW